MRTVAWLVLLLFGASPAGAEEIRKPILVGIDEAYPPHQFRDAQGQPAGFDVDLFRAVADEVGLEYQMELGPWPLLRERLENGEIDLNPGVFRTALRERHFDFSTATVWVHHAIFVREDSPVESRQDLRGSSVLVNRGGYHDDRIQEEHLPVRRILAETPEETLVRLAAGEGEAAVLLNTQGLYFIRKHRLENIRSLGVPLDEPELRFAVPEDHAELLLVLNDGLARVRETGTYDRIYDDWFGVLKPQGPWSTRWGRGLLAGLGLIALLLIASAAWSAALRRRVEARTRELRESEENRQRLQGQLLQAQKMEALGQLAAGISHDFNNLLTVIIGGVSTVLGQMEARGRAHPLLAQVLRAGESGADLTRQLLAFARRQAVEPDDVRWDDVVGNAGDMLQRLVGSRVSLVFRPGSDVAPVRLDPGQALQILMNLVINACDARAKTITIETGEAVRGDRKLVLLTVRDDGDGMDSETRERIFEPFFTSKARSRGTGLGLATVHGIVGQSGGTIEVESEPGAGSSFHVLLPTAPAPTAPERAEPPAPAGERRRTVLVVEDDGDVRELAAALLRSLDYEVTAAEDGETALSILEGKGSPETLLADVDLPGMSGPDLARRVLEKWPGVRVFFTSPFPGELDLPRGARYSFVTKPFTRESLAAALDEDPL
jgi:signal transduction histidine kinase/CheY-like chemotaxis protein